MKSFTCTHTHLHTCPCPCPYPQTALIFAFFPLSLSLSLITTYLAHPSYSTNKKAVKVYDDLLNTETIREPATIVIIPRNKEKQDFIIDVRYVDFTSAIDIPVGYSSSECYIVPPYKPLLYVGIQPEIDSYVDVYAIRGKKMIACQVLFHQALIAYWT